MTDDGLKVDEQRARGLVWVCDLANSSKYLNDNRKVADLEAFLPRFLWISRGFVGAAGGRFVKWTGDGFLSWFDTPLHRSLDERVLDVFFAAWHLTFAVHMTQLGLSPKQKFRIRHGVTYEHDGLTMHVPRVDGGAADFDVIGRSVVLAFRLAGVDAKFPCITTQRDLAHIARKNPSLGVSFLKRTFNASERLKHFKGEQWGTDQIYSSNARAPERQKATPSSIPRAARRLDNQLKQLKGKLEQLKGRIKGTIRPVEDFRTRFGLAYVEYMGAGPEWCRSLLQRHVESLLGTLEILERLPGLGSELLSMVKGEIGSAKPTEAAGSALAGQPEPETLTRLIESGAMNLDVGRKKPVRD